MTTGNSFGARAQLKVGNRTFEIFKLDVLERRGLSVSRLPYSLRILLENLLRREDGRIVAARDVEALARWDPKQSPVDEIAFMPARVLMQDFTGVPAVVDLAAMRDAMQAMGGDPKKVNPLLPAELVIDHSVIVDEFGTSTAFQVNADLEFQRNRERYALLRWAQRAFQGFRVVPPDTGIVHQVNLEYLARVVFTAESPKPQAYPDTLVGTDSHTTMINGLGVLGWGVGGIEAEAAMLGQPVSMLIPQVVGFRLTGKLAEGATATDLVLTVTEMLRKKGVVGKFVEFYGPGIASLPLADRATIGNMAPEYGATVGIFPVDQETLRYLEFTGRPKEQVQLVEADNRGGVSQFALATCGDLAGRAHGWIARLAALAPRRRHEHCVRAGAGALHRRSRAGKALVVWMREDEEEGGALGAHRRRLVTPGRFPFSMELGGLKGVGVRSRFSIPIEKSGSDPDLPGPRGLPG